MKIKFFNPNSLDRNLKATIHKSGKLGFTVDAANKMELKANMSASVGMNEEDKDDRSLYVMLHSEAKDASFRVAKAGDYFYLNLKSLFDTLKINYKERSIIYDISEEEFDGQKIYKLAPRENGRKNKSDGNGED